MPEIYVEGLKPKTFKNNDTAERKTKIGKITPVDARLLNAFTLSRKVGIIDGYGGNCTAINTTITANNDNTYTITLNKGAVSIYGGVGIIEQGTTINIPSSITNGSFGVKVNLQNSAGAEMQFYYKSQSEALIQNDLQDDEISGIYEFELYKYTISGSVMTLTSGVNLKNKIVSQQEAYDSFLIKTQDYVVENKRTATGWYRKWASGFKELGGVIKTSGNGDASLTFDAFENTNYTVDLTPISNVGDPSFTVHARNLTTTGCQIKAFSISNGGTVAFANMNISYYIAGF